MPQLDATTQGLEGLFQRGVQSVNCATGTGPGQEYHRDPHSSVLAVPAARADFAVPSSPVAGTLTASGVQRSDHGGPGSRW